MRWDAFACRGEPAFGPRRTPSSSAFLRDSFSKFSPMFREIRNRLLRLAAIAIWFALILACAVELNFLWLFGYSPSRHEVEMPMQNVSSELYTADSVLIGRYFKEDRIPVEYDSISPNVVNALIATEDSRFYKHHGVDYYAVMASLVSTAQGERRGGSTITQQLAK